MDIRLSDAEKIFLITGVEEDIRHDGRSCRDYRQIFLERGALSTTDGSARVRIDTTDMLIGVKCELQNVEDSSKVENRLHFSVDCSANASPVFEGKGGDNYAEDIVSALEAAYRNDFVLPDMKKLILSKNHIWVIYVDIVILQYGGSIIDAAAIGVKAALSDTAICVLNMRRGDANKMLVELPDSDDTWSLDTSKCPLIVSVNKIGSANVVDCSETEEACIRSALWIAVCPAQDPADSLIPLIRQTGGGSLEHQSVDDMVELAVDVANELHSSVNNRLADEAKKPRTLPGHTFLK